MVQTSDMIMPGNAVGKFLEIALNIECRLFYTKEPIGDRSLCFIGDARLH